MSPRGVADTPELAALRAAEPRQWRIDLPFATPLSMNDREHWASKAAKTRHMRRAAHVLVRAAHIPVLPRVTVTLHYAPRDARRRDPLNLAPTLKACEDGCVDAGLMADDNADVFTSTMPVIDPPAGRNSGMYLIVQEVLGPQIPQNRTARPVGDTQTPQPPLRDPDANSTPQKGAQR